MICKNNKPFIMPKEIMSAIEKGSLVLFCGAGISTENKTVMPNSLYDDVHSELNRSGADSFSELMSLYCKQVDGRKKLL
jgi:hypothetical protein